MRRIPVFLSLILLAVAAEAQSRDGLTIRCTNSSTNTGQDELIQPMSTQEAAKFRTAPHGARRIGKHQLEISWVDGKKLFADRPPYNEPLDGVVWAYCGYDSKLSVHLIRKQDRDIFTGVLLDDRTGSLLPAGESVLFSPDERYYLAYEQPDGQDGETIKLYERNGTLLWKGFNGILSRDGKSVVAEFEEIHWDNHGWPQAYARLDGSKTVVVTLTQNGKGKWEWLPPLAR